MALENKYGKSAVDATRRNALPQYVDALGEQIGGEFLSLTGGTLTGQLTIDIEEIDANSSALVIDTGAIKAQNGDVIIGNGNKTTEMDLIVNGGAGGIYVYSAASSTGNRGIWLSAHGTASDGRIIVLADTNNKTTFSGDKFKGAPGSGSNWIKGRDDAIFKMESITSTKYNAMLSIKTTNGSWEMGEYDNGSNVNRLYFTYAKDTNYNNNTNTVAQAYLNPRDSGAYPISLASMSLSGTTLTITDPQATVS